MILQNKFLSLEFDERTGSLTRLDDVQRGVRHLQAPGEGRLFKLTAPDDKRNFNRHCDNRYSRRPPRLEQTQDGLVISYDELNTEEGDRLPIGVVVRVALDEASEEASFEIEVQNHTQELIQEVHFPYFGGWRGDTRPGKTELRMGHWHKDIHTLRQTPFNGFGKTHRRLFVDTQLTSFLPCMDLAGQGQGISYIPHLQKPTGGGLYLEDANERRGEVHLVWSWVFRPFLSQGAKWSSVPVAIGVHDGDWHVTADRMRRWLRTWWKAPPIPAGLRGSLGFFMTQYHEFCGGGTILNSPQAILENARYCQAHGLDHIQIWDPMREGNLRPINSEVCEYSDPAEQAAFARLVHDIRALGVHVSGWIGLRHMDRGHCQMLWTGMIRRRLFELHLHIEYRR